MSIAEKLTQIAENQQKVYDAGYEKGKSEGGDTTAAYEQGKQAEYDRFWNGYQQNGERTNYKNAFTGDYWNADTLRPKHTCKVVADGGISMFSKCNFKNSDFFNLLDISHISIDVSEATNCDRMFGDAKVNGVTLIFSDKVTTLTNAFTKSSGGTIMGMQITLLVPNPKCNWTNAFSYHKVRRLILLEGTVIGTNGFSVQWANDLPHDDLIGILNALEDKSGDTSGTTWTVTIGATNKAKLTDDELEIAYEKGWTVN